MKNDLGALGLLPSVGSLLEVLFLSWDFSGIVDMIELFVNWLVNCCSRFLAAKTPEFVGKVAARAVGVYEEG